MSPRRARRQALNSGLFSDSFGLKIRPGDDWFDPILNLDTRLFLDPFLLFQDESRSWRGAHAELISYFDSCFRLLARSGRNPRSLHHQKAVNLLRFPEPKEFCLGYVQQGTRGAGAGRGHAVRVAGAILDAIDRGVAHPSHFEDIGIFNEGIGPDRISDIACNILRPRFIKYTQQVARRHRLPMQSYRMGGARFDQRRSCWRSEAVDLPRNPFSGGPILLVPARFLRDLPVVNASDWWESSEAAQLRADLNLDVMERVDKATIVRIAREHPEAVDAWVRSQEQRPASSYDLHRDPAGVHLWASAAARYVASHPLALKEPANAQDFLDVVGRVVERFRHFIEEERGWRLLWNDDGSEKPEEAAQLAFLGVARPYCEANNIVLDREVNLGRGPVDFKFSGGYSARALLEFKKVHNGKFWNGLLRQLPSYLKSDRCSVGWFGALQYNSRPTSRNRVKRLRTTDWSQSKRPVSIAVIDARRKRSASKL